MKQFKLTDTHELVLLEKGEEGDFAYDGEGNVYLEIACRTHSQWRGCLASQITEEQAKEILYPYTDKEIPDLCLMIIKGKISQALKAHGLTLREGERPPKPATRLVYGLDEYFEKKKAARIAWFKAIPLNRILITEK